MWIVRGSIISVGMQHQAAGVVVGHMIVLQAVVCEISTGHMLEVLPIIVHPLKYYSGGHWLTRSSKVVGMRGILNLVRKIGQSKLPRSWIATDVRKCPPLEGGHRPLGSKDVTWGSIQFLLAGMLWGQSWRDFCWDVARRPGGSK